MLIDVLIPVAEKGGVENVIKIMLQELESAKMYFRVIQLVWEGTFWLPENVDFHPLLEGRKGHTLQEFADIYADFLKNNDKPDIILAVGWPYMCCVGRAVAEYYKMETKIVSWLHNPLERYEVRGYGGIEELKQADYHLAISQAIYDHLSMFINEKYIFRVKNPVKIGKRHFLPVSYGKKLCHKLLSVGRIESQKNLELLVRCMADLPQWSLDIVGDGSQVDYLKALAEKIDVAGHIRWHGWKEDPWHCVETADAFIMSSIYEGFPLVAIEAMSHGLPVISTSVDGIAEIVKEDVTGYLYDINNDDTLISLLEKIDARGYVVNNCYECIRLAESYDSRQVMEKMRSILWKLI